MEDLLFWIFATLACIAIQSLYSMQEMALVSFNKIRLQYYEGRGYKRARWIRTLLQDPSKLFGTTLVMVNLALQVGSECSRRVYLGFGLNPDIAPLTQVFLVMVFAEIAPMFAARRYSEQVAMLGIPVVYTTSLLLKPVIWLIAGISRLASLVIGAKRRTSLNMLSREELEHIVEGPEEEIERGGEADPFNRLVTNIFSLRAKVAKEAMTPLPSIRMLRWDARMGDMRKGLSHFRVPCLPLYYETRSHIVAIAFPRDVVLVSDKEPLRHYARQPWFITHTMPLTEILKQFRHNNQDVAVVLDQEGRAIGLLTLEDILEELFGKAPEYQVQGPLRLPKGRLLVERSFPADTPVEEFNALYNTRLEGKEGETFGDLLRTRLDHPPEEGDTVRVGDFELSVVESGLLGPKVVGIKSLR
ncbi:MAG: hemolysin family protein [Parachlamydiales bacterium]